MPLGSRVREVAGADLQRYEPHLGSALAAGAFYPQDAQVQPMLLVAHLLRMARELGATVQTQTAVIGVLRDGDRVTGVSDQRRSSSRPRAVVNAAGPWAGETSLALAGVELPCCPGAVRARHRAAAPDRAAQGLRGRVRR